MDTHTRNRRRPVYPQPNITVGVGIIIKTIISIAILSASWIGYNVIVSYISSGPVYSLLINYINQSHLVARWSAYAQNCVDSRPHTPEIGIFINITLSTFLILYMAYNKIWGCPGYEAVLERPILDLYDHIVFITVQMAYTYYYHLESNLPSILPTSLYLLQCGNISTTLLYTLLEERRRDRLTNCLIVNTLTLLALSSDSESSTLNRASWVISIIFWSYKTSTGTLTRQASNSSRHPVRNAIPGQNIFSKSVDLIWHNISSLFLALISLLSLSWAWKLYNWQCLLGNIFYQMTYSQVIPVIALFKPVVNIYYYMCLSTSIPNNGNETLTSSSTALKSSDKWNFTFLSIFLFSKGLWYPAALSSCCTLILFAISKPDTVTITVRRPISTSDGEGLELSGSHETRRATGLDQRVPYETMNVFEIRHTFSDIHLIWSSRVDQTPPGYHRIVWKCSCGDMLAANFDNSAPHAVKTLEERLHEIGSNNYTPNLQTGRDPLRSTENSGSHALHINPSGKSSANKKTHKYGRVLSSGSSFRAVEVLDIETIMERQDLNNGNGKKYLEVCVSSGRHTVSLGEVNISSVTSDAQLFDEIWKTYRGIKGTDWRTTLHNWFLEPDDVLFVLFGVLRRHQVGIYKQPLEIPPEVEVDEGRYDYYECPMKVLPPMPGNIFLHYLEHAKKKATSKKETPMYHADSTFLKRLPKKLETSIFAGDAAGGSSISYGWGIHIVERPSTFAQNLVAGFLAFVSAAICFIIFGITWATLGLDEAIGIGQYTAGVLTLLNTAFYFSLQAYCNYFSPRKL